MKVDSATRLVGVIGWPVEHSLSPAMHNAAFEALGLKWVYLPLPVPPKRVGDAVHGLPALGFAGANVTVPHKQSVIPYLDRLTPAAQAIGAVNTIIVEEDGQLTGDNTDAAGFVTDLQEAGIEPASWRPLLLGSGGAARAAAYALGTAGVTPVHILARAPSRAEAMAKELEQAAGLQFTVGCLPDDVAQAAETANLVINATSVGMSPHVDASPWPDVVPFRPEMAAYDLVYNPAETRFLQQARGAGARAIGGLGMLVHQGAAAFRLWTNQEPSVTVMREMCERRMRG